MDAALILDPWGNEYLYDASTEHQARPRIYTLGSDAAIGGEGSALDIDNIEYSQEHQAQMQRWFSSR